MFLAPLQFARGEGDAVPTRGEQQRSTNFVTTPLRKVGRPPRTTARKLLHIETSAESEESSLSGGCNSARAIDAVSVLYGPVDSDNGFAGHRALS